MRIVRVQTDRGPEWGVVVDEEVRHLSEGPFGSLGTGDSIGLLDDLTLLAPASPSKIVCIGRNYTAHAAEHGAEVPAEPLLFLKPPSSIIAPGAEIVVPELSSQVEHECELALVISARCREVPVEQAWEYVLGVTCGNDVTARDLQRSDPQWTRGKGFDTFCPLGPWIVSGLSEEEARQLEITCTVNEEARQKSNTSMMVFSPAALIAYITRVMTLEPGDVIMTGTPSGVGPLFAGDTVEIEIENVGVLRNTVAAERNRS
jgi:2-keto-4-pentenoate hydratase/2-oxohepta-3-ene-1,7-dioic acid hydratase in catechol pathway